MNKEERELEALAAACRKEVQQTGITVSWTGDPESETIIDPIAERLSELSFQKSVMMDALERRLQEANASWSRMAGALSRATRGVHNWQNKTPSELASIAAHKRIAQPGAKRGGRKVGYVAEPGPRKGKKQIEVTTKEFRRTVVKDYLALRAMGQTRETAAIEVDEMHHLVRTRGELTPAQVESLMVRLDRWRKDTGL